MDMDVDAASFVLDRVDVARMALLEARQVIDKFNQPEDQDVARLLDEMLARLDQADSVVRSGSYPPS